MEARTENLHATAIAVAGRGVLLRGASGAGKSDLALRCLAAPNSLLTSGPVELVSDDQVVLVRRGAGIEVLAPDAIRGKLEVRGIGIISVGVAKAAQLVLVADLVPAGGYERLPDPERRVTYLGLSLPVVEIAPFEGSAALKLLLALQQAGHA